MGGIKPRGDILENIFGDGSTTTHMDSVLSWITWALQFIYAIMVLVAFVSLIVNITKLAKSSSNPPERARALHGILVSGICIAGLGGFGLLFLVIISFM